jgi:hypothetical protein
MSEVFAQACQTAACLQCNSLESPVGRITEPIHEISALPLKPIAGTTKLKAVVEKVTFEPGTDVPLDAIADLLSSKTYQELPGPVALKDDIPVPFTLLLVFRKVNENKYLVIKYYIFSQKVGTRLVQRIASGDLFVIDYGKNFGSGSVAFQYLLERVGKLCHSHLSVRTKPQTQARKGLPWKRDLLTSRVMVQRAI